MTYANEAQARRQAEARFPGETPEQIEAHIRIARRRHSRTRPKAFTLGTLRLSELYKVIAHLGGSTLPDDDYGRDVVREVLNQLALEGATPDELRQCGFDLLPETYDDDTLDGVIEDIGKGKRRNADAVARALGIDFKTRVALDLRTIGAVDMSKKRREALFAQKHAADKRWKREKAGAKPHAKSSSQTQPWEAEGVNRRTYSARKKTAQKTEVAKKRRHTTKSSLGGQTTGKPAARSPAHPPETFPCEAAFDQQAPASGIGQSHPPRDFCAAEKVEGENRRPAKFRCAAETVDRTARAMRAAVEQASRTYQTCAASDDSGAALTAAAALGACLRAERAFLGKRQGELEVP